MKRIKATKTNIEKLHHPTGKTPDKYFASNCSGLCVIIQPEPSVVKSYYGHWSKIILQPDGIQKRSGRYKYICRVGDKTIEAVITEVKLKLKDWKKEKSQSSKTKAVADLAKAFIAGGAIAGPRSIISLCPDLVDCSNLYWRLNYPASGFGVGWLRV